MSLTHIVANACEAYCGHPNPDSWTTDEDEATCADCIKLFMRAKVEKVEGILEETLHIARAHPDIGPHMSSVITKAEEHLGVITRKKA